MISTELVLVTGCSGFIATWVTKLALDAGYRVRGTVRDPTNEKKVKVLKDLPGASERLELVALDLEKSDQSTFDKVVEGCTLVAHTASPFPAKNPKSEDELIVPAVNGTLSMLKAALKASTVKKVVITSSVAAVGSSKDASVVRGEKDWTDVTGNVSAYPKSKTLAEKAAWDFYKEHKPSWSLSTINPAYVVGPYIGAEKTTSAEVGIRILSGSMPMIPNISFGIVDVRDVAAAHIKVLESDPSLVNGRRFILCRETRWMKEIAQCLSKEFKPLGYTTIPTRNAPYLLMWLVSWFDPAIALIFPRLDKITEYDNTPSKEILKIDYRSLESTFNGFGHSLIYHGMVKKTSEYKPPRPDWTPATAD